MLSRDSLWNHISLAHFLLSPAESVAALPLPKLVCRHANLPGCYCRAPVLFPKHRISDYHHCLPSIPHRRPVSFESILSCRLQKSRAMVSKWDARISRRLFCTQKTQHELSYFQKSALFQLYRVVCNVCFSLGSRCTAMCKLTLK